MVETNLQSKKDQEDYYSQVTIRPYDLRDIKDFMAWSADKNVYEFSNLDPTAYTCRRTTFDYFLQDVIPHPWYRAICLNNRAIGEIVVRRSCGDDRCRAEVEYCLGSKYWGKGIMAMALKLAASTIFIDWPTLERLEAVVDVENQASQRVLEKVGFIREGVMRKYYLLKGKPRDMVMFSLLPSDLPLFSMYG